MSAITKIKAVLDICRDARAEKNTRTSYRRIVRAAAALGLSDDERNTLLTYLDYINRGTGEPYEAFK